MPVQRRGAITGEVHFGYSLEEYATRGLLAKLAARQNLVLPPLTEVVDVPPLPAYLNRDQWSVACPDCMNGDMPRSSAFVWPDEPLFMCSYCWNVAVGGLWRPVAMPRNRAAIEETVGLRPMPHTRNWRGERLRQLQKENRENGVPERVE